jgi:alpha-1,3-mannosyl-glycoprotein beta-1,2-N-acetylglucosaminyltransferase
MTKGNGEHYYHIALHYKFALNRLFAMSQQYDGVIILEEDIDVAPDALAYFRAVRREMLRDESIWTVSAWNDNGGALLGTPDERALHRADFFPGLGWLLTAKLWRELGPSWPIAFWDDWMREHAQRRGRVSIRPELSRTHTFGAMGASNGQFFASHLVGNKVSEGGVDWPHEDLGYLLKVSWRECECVIA